MKRQIKFISWLIAIACVSFWLTTGCTTNQQSIAYKTIGSINDAANITYSHYADLVIAGTISTNSLPAVSLRYNQIKSACLLAATASSNGTNAIAPAALTAELADFTSFIATLKTTK